MANIRLADMLVMPPANVAHVCSQRFGWRVVPAHLTEKRPGLRNWQHLASSDLDQVQEWWTPGAWTASRNVCVVTGRESGIWVLDVDPRHGGDVTLARLVEEYGPLPETLIIDTPSGGQHYYWAYPAEGEIKTGTNLGAANNEVNGLDTRGEGGQVMAPFTSRAAGVYRPRNAVEPVLAPAWLETLARRVSRSQRANEGSDDYDEGVLPSVNRMVEEASDVAPGGQEAYLFRFLSKLRALNRSPEEMAVLGWEVASRFSNETGHRLGDWTREHVDAKVVYVLEKYEAGQATTASETEIAWARNAGQTREAAPVTSEDDSETGREEPQAEPGRESRRETRLVYDMLQSYSCDHRGMADIFLNFHSNDIRWNLEEQRFIVFDGERGSWAHDGKRHETVHRLTNKLATMVSEACETRIRNDEAIQQLLRTEGTDREARALQAEGRRRAAAIRAWTRPLSSTGNIRSVIDAVVPEAISCSADDFDQAVHLLNLLNGTYDVTRDVLREHRQADLLTHLLPFNLDLGLAEKPLAEVAPLFHSLIWRMCGAPGELDALIHQERYDAVCRYLGYQLHGSGPAKKLGVFIGANDIGKNQVLEIVAKLLDTLASTAFRPSLLTMTRNDRHESVELPLRGKRMAVVNELSRKQTLDENQVLRLVNPEGSTVSLRQMSKDSIEVPATWKLTVSTNDLPHGELTPQLQTRLAIFQLSKTPVPVGEKWDIKRAILNGGTRNGVTYASEVTAVLAHLVKWWREWWVASQEAEAAHGGLLVTSEMRQALSDQVESQRSLETRFIDDVMELASDAQLDSGTDIMEYFNEWAKRNYPREAKNHRVTRTTLYEAISNLPGVTDRTRKIGQKADGTPKTRLLGWDGVRWDPESTMAAGGLAAQRERATL